MKRGLSSAPGGTSAAHYRADQRFSYSERELIPFDALSELEQGTEEAALRAGTEEPSPDADPSRLIFDGLAIDRGRRLVMVAGHTIRLTPTEFDLLVLLAERPNTFVSKKEIMQRVIVTAHDPQSPLLRVIVHNMRSKLGSARQTIQTVRGRGYYFSVEHAPKASGTSANDKASLTAARRQGT